MKVFTRTMVAAGILFTGCSGISPAYAQESDTYQMAYSDTDALKPVLADMYSLQTGTMKDTKTETKQTDEQRKKTEFYQKIADAAQDQIGTEQDCTMLVTNSLAAVGVDFHGGPEEYLSLGTKTDHPVPGDICVYQGHVAVYIGNGQAVHGGWNGYTTIQSTVECTSPLIGYVHINR